MLVNSGSNPSPRPSPPYGDEKRVVFAESPVYGRPVSVIDAYKRIMDRGLAAGVPGYRAMGFIDFDNVDLPWQEWLLYEAAVNRVFADYPFRTLCPYDTTEVEPGILEAIRCTHTVWSPRTASAPTRRTSTRPSWCATRAGPPRGPRCRTTCRTWFSTAPRT